MLFEFNNDKSNTNKTKHGINFYEAQEIFLDDFLLKAPSLTHNSEIRDLNIGKIKNKLWVAVTVNRNNRVRIISVRRARKSEEKQYYEN